LSLLGALGPEVVANAQNRDEAHEERHKANGLESRVALQATERTEIVSLMINQTLRRGIEVAAG
jgi:hypothetical protein